jgi:hypothetical protein
MTIFRLIFSQTNSSDESLASSRIRLNSQMLACPVLVDPDGQQLEDQLVRLPELRQKRPSRTLTTKKAG